MTTKKNQKNKIKAWLQLGLGLATIYLLVAVVLPFLSHLPLSQAAIEVIEERQIDPRALFYTESEQAVEAGREVKERMKELKNERIKARLAVGDPGENEK